MEFEDNEEGWAKVLTTMAHCLDMMDEDYVNKFLPAPMQRTLEDYKRASEIMQKHKDQFFELFSKYFYALWD